MTARGFAVDVVAIAISFFFVVDKHIVIFPLMSKKQSRNEDFKLLLNSKVIYIILYDLEKERLI